MSFFLEDICYLLLKEYLLKEFVLIKGWYFDVLEKVEFF